MTCTSQPHVCHMTCTSQLHVRHMTCTSQLHVRHMTCTSQLHVDVQYMCTCVCSFTHHLWYSLHVIGSCLTDSLHDLEPHLVVAVMEPIVQLDWRVGDRNPGINLSEYRSSDSKTRLKTMDFLPPLPSMHSMYLHMHAGMRAS